jgi:hypothetical protein
VNYAPSARLEDRLHPLEPPYRSRGEAQVGRLLDREQIPFLYEQPTLIYDRGRHRIWRPDFTLPTYGGLDRRVRGDDGCARLRSRDRAQDCERIERTRFLRFSYIRKIFAATRRAVTF